MLPHGTFKANRVLQGTHAHAPERGAFAGGQHDAGLGTGGGGRACRDGEAVGPRPLREVLCAPAPSTSTPPTPPPACHRLRAQEDLFSITCFAEECTLTQWTGRQVATAHTAAAVLTEVHPAMMRWQKIPSRLPTQGR